MTIGTGVFNGALLVGYRADHSSLPTITGQLDSADSNRDTVILRSWLGCSGVPSKSPARAVIRNVALSHNRIFYLGLFTQINVTFFARCAARFFLLPTTFLLIVDREFCFLRHLPSILQFLTFFPLPLGECRPFWKCRPGWVDPTTPIGTPLLGWT